MHGKAYSNWLVNASFGGTQTALNYPRFKGAVTIYDAKKYHTAFILPFLSPRFSKV